MASSKEPFGAPVVVDPDAPMEWEEPSLGMSNFDFYNPDPAFEPTHFFEDSFAQTPAAGTPAISYASPAKPHHLRNEPNGTLSQHQTTFQPRSAAPSSSPESSSHDSSSESSGRRKRKMSSESPVPTQGGDGYGHRGWEPRANGMMDLDGFGRGDSAMSLGGTIDPTTLTNLDPAVESIDRSLADGFSFASAASSPDVLESQNNQGPAKHPTTVPVSRGFRSADFFLGSREASPTSGGVPTNSEPSPSAAINAASPKSAGGDMLGQNVWNTMHQSGQFSRSAWNPETVAPQVFGLRHHNFSNNFAHPQIPHAPMNPAAPSGAVLIIHPIQAKSRVETQISVKMTLHPVPPGIKRLHLPTRTISKSKLLAKAEERVLRPDTLELSTALVCTSAMQKDHIRERILKRVRGAEDDTKLERRGSSTGEMSGDEDQDDPSKPLSGGEVNICENCINRERKRASRKRVKNEEDESFWKGLEAQRVIVFNEKEYQEWQPPSAKDGPKTPDDIDPLQLEGAMCIDLPMRIACYCRHQHEKIGFQVIFTLKDHEGNFVAQACSKSILITDDHKTQAAPPASASYVYDASNLGAQFSSAHTPMQPSFHTRQYHSTNDLQSLGQNYAWNPASQATSASITPRVLSRQASPSAHVGPNKKRKPSSSTHPKIPANLRMTQLDPPAPPPAPGMTSAAAPLNTTTSTMTSPFAPPGSSFISPTDSSLMGAMAPQSAFNATPASPNSTGFFTPNHRSNSIEFYSAPNSALPSRAPSPASVARPQNTFHQQSLSNVSNILTTTLSGIQSSSEPQPSVQQIRVHKVLPSEGSKSGGIEVTCLGSGFERTFEVMFGDTPATTTTFWSHNTLVCLLPPSAHSGLVPVTLRRPHRGGLSPVQTPGPQAFFNYVDDDEKQLFELALRFMCEKETGTSGDIRSYARQIVQRQTGMQTMQSSSLDHTLLGVGIMNTEDVLLRLLDKHDMDDSPYPAKFNVTQKNGATMLSLAAGLGYNRFVAGLLARGAYVDPQDISGYTPLMMAALHGHAQIVRRLILKGADPMIRSRRGYIAVDLASNQDVLNALIQVQYHTRSRSTGALSPRSRASSIASMHSVWESQPSQTDDDSSNEDQYEDSMEGSTDLGESVDPTEKSASRRNSTTLATNDGNTLTAGPSDYQARLFPAEMMAMARNHLSAQFQQFQQNVHFNFPAIALPTIPPMLNLPDSYQAHPIVRQISSLVPHRTPSRNEERQSARTGPGDYIRDLFSSSPSEPPAYEELYGPGRSSTAPDSKKLKQQTAFQAAAETIIDRKCAEVFDTVESQEPGPVRVKRRVSIQTKSQLDVSIGNISLTEEEQDQLRKERKQKLKRIRSDRNLWLFWIPLFLLIIIATVWRNYPRISAVLSAPPMQLTETPEAESWPGGPPIGVR